MNNFQYTAAGSIDEVVSLLAAQGPRAKILAGGTDLLVQLRETPLEADLLIDVKHVAELMSITSRPDGGLTLGAAVPCTQIDAHPAIARHWPGLQDVARILGGWQIQSRASFGGNLCNASPAADSAPALIAYAAECRIAGPEGVRRVPVHEFCVAPRQTVLGRGELLVDFELPPPAPRSGARYLRFIPRNEMDIAVVGAGCWVQLDPGGQRIAQARIGLGAVAPTPLLAEEASAWLAGQPATEDTFTQAGELAKRPIAPISDMRADADYRRHLVGVLTRRALADAVRRARGETVAPGPAL